jgi:hypothetical protein
MMGQGEFVRAGDPFVAVAAIDARQVNRPLPRGWLLLSHTV